ncbi:MAG: Gfo/Idh/MocA family protein [Parvularculaceae bacterium]
MVDDLRWGVLGAGIIAHKLVDAVGRTDGCRLVAVASNTPGKGEAFADKWGIDAAATYEALVARADVDVVYVATTHDMHFDNARLALDAGKHALVEKPFTVNAGQARALADLARARRLFLMEAMWVRYLPSIVALRDAVARGAIGELRFLDIVFGPVPPPQFQGRLLDPARAGGASLDLGVYPITFANFLLGAVPSDAGSFSAPAPTGVDETAVYQFRYPSGALANIAVSFALPMAARATLYGTAGRIDFPDFQAGQTHTVHRYGEGGRIESRETFTVENDENGFVHQVEEVRDAVRAGQVESAAMPLDETIATMALIDDMRAAWGLRYPFET